MVSFFRASKERPHLRRYSPLSLSFWMEMGAGWVGKAIRQCESGGGSLPYVTSQKTKHVSCLDDEQQQFPSPPPWGLTDVRNGSVGVLVVYIFSGCMLKEYSCNKTERWNQDIMSETVFARAARHGPGPFYTRSVRTHLNLIIVYVKTCRAVVSGNILSI